MKSIKKTAKNPANVIRSIAKGMQNLSKGRVWTFTENTVCFYAQYSKVMMTDASVPAMCHLFNDYDLRKFRKKSGIVKRSMFFNVEIDELILFELAINDFEHGSLVKLYEFFKLEYYGEHEAEILITKDNYLSIPAELLRFADEIENIKIVA